MTETSNPIQLMVQKSFNVKPEQVYAVWLDKTTAGRWWFATPNGVMQKVEINPKEGGEFVIVEKRGDQLAEHFGKFVELLPYQQIIFTFATDLTNNPTCVTLDIKPTVSGCELTLSHDMDPAWAVFEEKARMGWTMILDGLANFVESTVVNSRVLPFPDAQVYKAWTDPQYLQQWWGPKGFSNTFEVYDFKPEGDWRFVMHGPDGADYPNHIVFKEIVPGKRVELLHLSGHVFTVIATFEDLGAQTRYTFRQIFETPDHCAKIRDFVTRANEENIDRLEALLERISK